MALSEKTPYPADNVGRAADDIKGPTKVGDPFMFTAFL